MKNPLFFCLLFLALLNAPLKARVIGLEGFEKTSVMAGHSFGPAGSYEYLTGVMIFGIEPNLSSNKMVCDLDLAPVDRRGLVISKSKFIVLQPKDPDKRNGIALIEVSNRGGKALLRYYNGALTGQVRPNVPSDYGDEHLLKQGYTLVWFGWEWDVPPQDNFLRLEVPILKNKDGSPLTGPVRTDWVIEQSVSTLSLGHRTMKPYPVAAFDSPLNLLTYRNAIDGYKTVVPRSQWSFSVMKNGASIKDSFHITLKEGFKPGYIYELTYQAQDPVNVGLGFTALRDLASFIKYDQDCPFSCRYTLAQGISQTGRFLRHFIYEGFNRDESGRSAVDAMLIYMAGAGRGSFNHRFAQPSRDAHRYSSFDYPTDLPPFAKINPYPSEDTRIMYINSGYEYWGRAASLIHIDMQGHDIPLNKNERYYHISSMQHYAESMPDSARKVFPQYDFFKGNPLNPYPTYKALMMQMKSWLLDRIEPLDNQIPTIASGTITQRFKFKFPYIPGLDLPIGPYTPSWLFFGPRWAKDKIIDQEPPIKGATFKPRIPTVDEFGNEQGGIKSIELRVPIATYTPWSQRYGLKNSRELDDFRGLFIPLPYFKANRTTRDMRPVIGSLYPDKHTYLQKIDQALDELIKERLLLEEDLPAQKSQCSRLWDWVSEYYKNKL